MKKPCKNPQEIFDYFPRLYGEIRQDQKDRFNKLFDSFCKRFDESFAYFASSSGRVEVLGNHTDHNGGLVLSSAISLDTICAFLPTDDTKITLFSEGFGVFEVDLENLSDFKPSSTKSLIVGICDYYLKNNNKIGGFKACCSSNVIGGAGISSSASFEVLIAEILNFLYNDGNISCEEKTDACWYAENVFFGKPCGKLDQAAIAFGGLNLIDFSNEDKIIVRGLDCEMDAYSFVLINTGGSHENLTDEYASIPLEMKQVANFFGKERLINFSKEDFFDKLSIIDNSISDRAISRAIHFYQENERVMLAYDSLKSSNYDKFVECVNNSGVSSISKLQNCYVEGAKKQPILKTLSILSTFIKGGAIRVHGGGFAGCVLSVVKNSYLNEFVDKCNAVFGKHNVIPLKIRSIGTIVL